MSLILIISILMLLVAMGWSVVIMRRLSDWRVVILPVMVALMATHQILAFREGTEIGETEAAALGVSLVTLLAMFFLERALLENKQSQRALQTSEERFRILVENSPDLIVTLDREGKILFINRTLPEYSVEGVLGTNVSDYLSAEDWPRYRQALDEVFELGEARSLEVAAVGPTSWLVRLVPLKQSSNSPNDAEVSSAMAISTEITERKRVEEAFRISERKYKDIFEYAPVGIYQSLRDGSILTANRALAGMLGYESVDELLTTNLAEDVYLSEEERRKLISEYEPTGFAADLELQWKKKDGTPIWISLNAHAVKDPEGRTNYYEGFVRDITDRKLAEEALRASEERFSKAFHASPHSMVITSLDEGRYLDVNGSFLKITGYSREEVIGRTSTDLNVWADAEDRAGMVRAIQEQGRVSDMELRFRRKSGEEFVALFSAVVITLDGRECMLTATNDITGRKQIEEMVREQREWLRVTLSSIGDAVIVTDTYGNVTFMNPVAETVTGWRQEEAIGAPLDKVFNIVNEETRRPAENPVAKVMKSGVVVGLANHTLLIAKDGREIPVDDSGAPIKDEEGNTKGVILVFHDITERKLAEEKQARLQADLYKSAREWKLTFDSVESPLMILDLDGQIIRLNQAARQLAERRATTLGRSPLPYEEIIRWHISDVGPGQPWQKAAELVSRIRQTHSRISCLIQDESSGKSWDITASVFSVPASSERIIVVARDITQTVRLQESLRRSETMSAMGTLVAGVAHEVRNPLFSLSATLDAFEARFGERGEYRRHINVLRGEVNRLNHLMGELLEYGRPHRLELVKDSIEGVIAQAVISCNALADRMKVRIDNCVEGRMERVMMDRKRMVQVFQNLIENAIQHSTAGGGVRIEAREESRNGQVWIMCEVSDEGPGFDEADLARVFEPFYTKRRGGTGLGLSIVHRIVEEHGGEIAAGNRAEGGARVEVRLPCARR